MRLLLILLSLVTIISCGKENNNRIQQVEGLYWDSVTYTKPPSGFYYSGTIVIRDTVLQKKVYKLNDSTYVMGRLFNSDTSFLPPPAPYSYPVLGNIKFVIRPDNSIIVDTDSTYSGSLNMGVYNALQMTISNIHMVSNLTPQFYEIHKLKKIQP